MPASTASEHRREQQQEPRRVRRQDEDQAVPLEVVLLPPARPLEHVVVQHVGVGHRRGRAARAAARASTSSRSSW